MLAWESTSLKTPTSKLNQKSSISMLEIIMKESWTGKCLYQTSAVYSCGTLNYLPLFIYLFLLREKKKSALGLQNKRKR